MKVWETSQDTDSARTTVATGNVYVSIHDPGGSVERRLYIEDDEGRMVVLKNEQIGELYLAIKPAAAGR